MKKIRLFAVVGPTATGKTEYGIRLAKQLDGEIISCDSMQIYKDVSIGTAKPDKTEMQGIPHHMMDIVDIGVKFSVAQYVSMARKCIADVTARGKTPIIVGGTGLYFNSLVDNIDFCEGAEDVRLRESLRQKAQNEGNEAVLSLLRAIDPETADKLHPNNLGRIIRAIEVYTTTGKTMSQAVMESRLAPSPYDPVIFGLTAQDRRVLYDRIERRVDIMMQKGLEREALYVLRSAPGSTCAQAIGYKEFIPYFNNECDISAVAGAIKLNTRHYAKRQLSWFRRDDRIRWINIDGTE
ncbi:MAG: tRNA (adenosine(37)-N6)-dimethylallyltransferase MiaA [Clostridia bacterium]|nr:tRNA (adenosine(37)-N6)-dimethylallyltransferase MiaA [Clostridia bacterium]